MAAFPTEMLYGWGGDTGEGVFFVLLKKKNQRGKEEEAKRRRKRRRRRKEGLEKRQQAPREAPSTASAFLVLSLNRAPPRVFLSCGARDAPPASRAYSVHATYFDRGRNEGQGVQQRALIVERVEAMKPILLTDCRAGFFASKSIGTKIHCPPFFRAFPRLKRAASPRDGHKLTCVSHFDKVGELKKEWERRKRGR